MVIVNMTEYFLLFIDHALVVSSTKHTGKCMIDLIDFWCLMPLSAIFQLYHGHLL
jgi:hypothetical protein